MSHQSLVLTTDFIPHKVNEWHASVTAVLSGKAYVIEQYDETISSPSIVMNIPAVIQLRRKFSRHRKNPPFSRVNVYQAFDWKCAYCGKRCAAKQLTYDHVIPRHQGGQTRWDNIVPACGGPKGCNARKRNRTPEEAGMRLLQKPCKPEHLSVTGILALPKHVPALWAPYLEGHRTMQLVG